MKVPRRNQEKESFLELKRLVEFIHTNFQKELVSIETSLHQFQSTLLYNPLSYRPTTLIPLITDAWSTISNRSKCRPPCLICLIKYPIHEPERIYFCTMETTWHQVLHLGRKIQKPCSFFHCIERNIIVKIIHIWDAQLNIQGYVVSRSAEVIGTKEEEKELFFTLMKASQLVTSLMMVYFKDWSVDFKPSKPP